MRTCQRIILGICCASMIAAPAFAAEPDRDVVLSKLAAAVESKSIDPSRLNVLADQCVRLKLLAAVPPLTQVIDHQLQRPASANGTVAYHMARVVAAVCDLGGRDDYRAMVKLFAAAPANSDLQRACVNTLLRYGCKYEIADALAKRGKQKLVFRELDEALPEHLQEAAAELQDAWRYYRRASAPFREISKKAAKSGVSAQLNWTQFYATLENSLVGNKKDNFGCVASFQWGSWCGTGSDMLYAPKSRAMVLELVRNGQFAESVGAALELSGSMMMGGSTNGSRVEFNWKQQLFEFCGLDWERLFLGKVVSGASGDELRSLGAYGSEETVKRLLILVNSPPRHEHSLASQLPILAMMVEPTAAPPAAGIFYGGAQPLTRTNDAPEISAESQKAILKVLHSHVNDAGEPRLVKELVDELVRLRRPESIPALRRAAALGYYKVAKAAAEALRSMGEDIALPKPPVDGKSSTMSSGGRTDAKGEIQIEGSWFADPRVNASVIKFSGSYFTALEQTFFATRVAVPADRKSPIDVPISTHPLRLVLNNAPADVDTKVGLEYRGPVVKPETSSSFYMSMGGQISVPLRGVLNFPRLGEGRYVISLDIPGRALWRSEEIVMDKPRELVVDLRPGAALRFELVAPGGKNADKQVQYTLVGLPNRNYHRHVDYTTRGFRGLPIGEYTLKILSSLEKRSSQRLSPNGDKTNEHECLPGDYSGREIKIVITKDKPVVDLGRIRLQLAAK
jgi:hypothetical protein